ncbi:VOC family protein [Spongiivirga sp. MCCC 1A20706]|uniref:VOC family protein n=1 Tax=Spongiivirga sp. MCCC 1A20706 TaxID=3160963 RepID=UPI003977375F
MKIAQYLFIVFLALSFLSCKNGKEEKKDAQITETAPSNVQLDHVNIWVKNATKAKERLVELGFTGIPDSLSNVHKGQGTTGRYFYFLNGYLELIFVCDQAEFEANNEKNTALDFAERVNFEANGASPFSIALNLKEYAAEKIPFKTVRYHQEWMDENSSIYAAQSSKKHLKEPSIFVVFPEIQYDVFESISDLNKIPEEYALWREFYKHPNGAKKITAVKITSPEVDVTTETIKAVNEIEGISVSSGAAHLMELYFDNNVQGKSYDLRPDLPLIIHL